MIQASYYLSKGTTVKLLQYLETVKEVIANHNFVEAAVSIEAVIVILGEEYTFDFSGLLGLRSTYVVYIRKFQDLLLLIRYKQLWVKLQGTFTRLFLDLSLARCQSEVICICLLSPLGGTDRCNVLRSGRAWVLIGTARTQQILIILLLLIHGLLLD